MPSFNIKDLKADFVSGFSVFLLALPLCLGIAMASNFPPIAGVFTAIVGGVLSSFLGSTRLSIKGPAAGLIVIALGAVNDLGGGDLALGYKRALAVGVIAAVIQILIALVRKAVVAEIMPPSVIHGMLAAIGVIIVSKQTHVMMGVTPHAKGPLALLVEIPNSIMNANPEIFFIGGLAIALSFLWPRIKKLAVIPSSIAVLLSAIALSFFFDLSVAHDYTFMGKSFHLGNEYLINLPSSIVSAITFPDFSDILSGTSIKYIIMFALVGSIESLLTVCAIDTIDPEKKQSDLNKDLFAVGVGNLVSALIGGLPMISEIVRSKANIDYGAKTKYSNFFHGMLLLLSIVIFPGLIQQIPLAALAALLVFTGLRLASPKEFVHVYKIGKDQFALFFITFIITLAVDLLAGVAIGIVLKVLLHMIRAKNLTGLFKLNFNEQKENETNRISIQGPFVFMHYLKAKSLLNNSFSENKKTILDLSQASIVDHTILDKLDYIKNETSDDQFQIIGLEKLNPSSSHHLAVRTL
ncbi:MAG: SulP family inorganic anion transporter [Deltaproteobacteria bacterium]|nr:SulP family inorganic anion transporter [Deltaproteobacteria bacterium]